MPSDSEKRPWVSVVLDAPAPDAELLANKIADLVKREGFRVQVYYEKTPPVFLQTAVHKALRSAQGVCRG